ncbi:MAG: hypothetical protein Q4C43_00775 [Prevotella sp.]|nr:hypothetical protein [Prevotella sp.]
MRSILIAITVLISITCCTDQKQKELMRHSLLTAKEQNENNQPFTTDSVMKDVTKYYDRHGSVMSKCWLTIFWGVHTVTSGTPLVRCNAIMMR